MLRGSVKRSGLNGGQVASFSSCGRHCGVPVELGTLRIGYRNAYPDYGYPKNFEQFWT